ncbi:hypothetical protein BDV26DRAFT_301047 [Aspergillus bertholletiae]|uniref:FAD/NAD(P)-binding domain-containing protein n=1 Tax=Aspergillus bertholletiae TaxID=1226010 RepID=A0A5N7BJ28_9EURO|nr:hypothetical protein BDV26DRAFT_301047 [Aspergillus bertholletiae]
MAPKANVVIIGASFAGIPIAHSLLKDPTVSKVTLINPSTTFYFAIAAPRVLAKPNAFKPEQYLLPIEQEFSQYSELSFEFVLGHATAIDVRAKTVSVDNTKTFPFDYLVIASGSTTVSSKETTTTPVPFKSSNSDNMKQLIQGAQQYLAGARRIVIGGGGPIGVELAGELAENARQTNQQVEITLVSASYRVLPMLKPAASAAAETLLAEKGVKVLNGQRVKKAEQSSDSNIWTVTLDDDQQSLTADAYIPTTGVQPNNSFIPDEFLDHQGWVVVNKDLRVRGNMPDTSKPLPIFAAGDITNNSMRLSFKAQEQASVVANNIRAEILGHGKRKSYDQGEKVMMIVPVGSTGGTGLMFGWTPWSFLVKIIKGKDFFISTARSAIAP